MTELAIGGSWAGGWNEPGIQQIVIVGGPSGTLSGVFVYSGPPAFGNLIASDSSVNTTDFYGNAVIAGRVSYFFAGGSDWYATALVGTGLAQYHATSASGPWTLDGAGISMSLSAGSSQLILNAAGINVGGPLISALVAMDPVAGFPTAETWHAATLSGSWANLAGDALEYRKMPDNTVFVSGVVVIPSGVTGPANTITNLPSQYRPGRSELFTLTETLPASPFTGTTHAGRITTVGDLAVFGAATQNNNLTINARYPLDTP